METAENKGKPDNIIQADAFKESGNSELKKKNNIKAVYFYSEAIKLNDQEPIYFSNRSAAYYNMEQFENALEDANQALILNPHFLKAYYRKAACLYDLDKLLEAKTVIEDSKQHGDYPEMAKIMEKIEKEYQMENLLPSSHPEILKIRSMESWLNEGKSKSIFSSMKIIYYSENYRGVHAARNIHINDTVLFIPKQFLITLEMAQTTTISQKIIKNNLELLSPKHSFLSTYILREKNNPKSFWKPYLDLLPTHYHSMPIFFTPEELTWLEGSPFLNQILDKKADLKKDYDAILQVAPELSDYTFNEFCWARMSASSRIFGIVINNAKTDAFVPYADMLNHKRPKQTNWSYSDEKGGFIIEANENIGKGEPVYDSYGRKCNSRFLLNYGFIVEANDANEVAVKVYFRENDNLIKMKESLMDQKILAKNFRIMANLEENSVKDLFGFVRFVIINNMELLKLLKDIKMRQGEDSEEEQSNSSFRPQSTPALSLQNEEDTLLYIKSLCENNLGKYRTTLQEDQERLVKNQLTFNERNCLLLRSGEKEILWFFVTMTEKILPIMKLSLIEAKKISQEKDYSGYLNYLNNSVFPFMKKTKNN